MTQIPEGYQAVPVAQFLEQNPQAMVRMPEVMPVPNAATAGETSIGHGLLVENKKLRMAFAAAAGVAAVLAGHHLFAGSPSSPHSATADIKLPPKKAHAQAAVPTPSAAPKVQPISADKFVPAPTPCEPSSEITVDSITPVTWNVQLDANKAQIYVTSKNDFAAAMKGRAAIISCLSDMSAMTPDTAATTQSGVYTLDVDMSKVHYVLDTTGVMSGVRFFSDRAILAALRAKNPHATNYELNQLKQFIAGNESKIDDLNSQQFRSDIAKHHVAEIVNLAEIDLQHDLMAEAEAQGVQPDKIAFKLTNTDNPALSLANVAADEAPPPPDSAFTYLYQESVNVIEVVKPDQTPQATDRSTP